MTNQYLKIGVAGTHSTGKSTFLNKLTDLLQADGLRVGRVEDLALAAKNAGFPILTEHTYESTLWIIAEVIKREQEQSLNSEVILVDRPSFDALGYLYAALSISSRSIPKEKLNVLEAITSAHAADYDIVILTELDTSLPIGEGRPDNDKFRAAAEKYIFKFAKQNKIEFICLNSTNVCSVLKNVRERISQNLSK